MAVNYPNIIDKGAVRAQDCPECTGCDATVADPIRAALVSGGVSSADLSAYDAAGSNTAIYLTSINTIAKVQSLRTATLSISGAYRIGNSDTNLEATTTGSTGSLSGPATPPEARLIANTAAVFAFVRPNASWSAATAVVQEPRKGTYPYESTAAGNLSKTLGVWTGPLVAEAPANTPVVAWVIKTPTIFESVDRNTAMWHQTSVGTGGSSNNQIGTDRTRFTTNNVTNRQWQMIAANVSAWPVTICSLDTSSGGTATQTVTGATVRTTFTVSGVASGSGLSTVTPTITRSNATISNVSAISVSGSTFTFSADVLVQAGEPEGSVSYTVTILGESVTVTGQNVIDTIAGALSTNLAAYISAADGDLVPVTAAEYSAVALATSAVKTSASDSYLAATTGPVTTGNALYRSLNFNTGFGQTMINGYTFGMRTRIYSSGGSLAPNTTVVGDFQIGFGTTNLGTGTALSNIGTGTVVTDANAYLYFIVKGASVLSPAGAFPTLRQSNLPSQGVGYATGSAPNLSTGYTNPAANVTIAPASVVNGWSFVPAFQFLQSATKQW